MFRTLSDGGAQPFVTDRRRSFDQQTDQQADQQADRNDGLTSINRSASRACRTLSDGGAEPFVEGGLLSDHQDDRA